MGKVVAPCASFRRILEGSFPRELLGLGLTAKKSLVLDAHTGLSLANCLLVLRASEMPSRRETLHGVCHSVSPRLVAEYTPDDHLMSPANATRQSNLIRPDDRQLKLSEASNSNIGTSYASLTVSDVVSEN
jgi:hypothetical protein